MKFRYLIESIPVLAGLLLAGACQPELEPNIRTGELVKTITTGDAVPTAITAALTGTVLDLSETSSSSYSVGFVYSEGPDPINGGTKQMGTIDPESGLVSATLTNLKEGTQYSYAVYVTLQNVITKFGEVKTFTATDAAVVTNDASNIEAVSAVLNGQTGGIDADAAKVLVGFRVASSEDALQNTGVVFSQTIEKSGTFTHLFEGAIPGNTYYYQAFVEIEGKAQYGEACSFTMASQDDVEYVDLGLSVLWAKCNLGAATESASGAFIGYGDLTGTQTSTKASDYQSANISGTENDIVLKAFGSTTAENNFIPTVTNFKELFAKTVQTHETVDGVEGIRFTAKNGNSIFLPAAGLREGASLVEAGGQYWTGNIGAVDTKYAQSVAFGSDKDAALTLADTYLGLNIRPVKENLDFDGIPVKNANLIYGDLEGNGTYRIEIYNEYGATKDAPVIDPSLLVYNQNFRVTFTLSGITTDKSYNAFLSYADSDWDPGNWQYNEDGEASVDIKGDGTYSVIFHGEGNGAVVMCIDIPELGADCPDVIAKIEKVEVDVAEKNASIKIKQDKLAKGDIENIGTYRVEIYNEYSTTKNDPPINPDDVKFDKVMRVVFTTEGIPAGKDYQAFLKYTDYSWGAGNWDFNADGNGSVIVNGDGTYAIDLATGPAFGAIVFCLDITDLAADLGADNVYVNIDAIIMDPDDSQIIAPKAGKIIWGDIESNGKMRIEIYNEYGATKEDPAIDPASIVFKENMAVRFTITGIDGNLKEDAASEHWAGLEYSDPTWGVGYWSGLTAGKYEANVVGDGTYTVWMETGTAAQGALVYCVDIADLSKDLVDPSLVNITVDDILLDCNYELKDLNNEIVNFNNKDGNGVDGRIEIYNEYSTSGSTAPQYYNDKLAFSGLMLVEFEISGVDGNLVAGADGSYKAELCYADADWGPSYWGGASYGNAEVTGDGTYQVYTYLNGDCSGAIVWTVELFNLWKDLVDTEAVSVNVKKVVLTQQ